LATSESIRRFDVESQRSVLKIEDCTLLPLTEWQKSRDLLVQLGELMREAGFHSRDLPPGRAVSRWNWWPHAPAAPSVVFSLLDRPIVLWDEPELVRGATERFWKRLEQLSARRLRPDRIYFRWEDLERQAGAVRGWPSENSTSARPRRPTPISPRGPPWLSRQHAGGHRRGRTLVESGNRVAFFASSTGEVERVADILNEYTIPTARLEQFDSTPAYLAERAYLAGSWPAFTWLRG